MKVFCQCMGVAWCLVLPYLTAPTQLLLCFYRLWSLPKSTSWCLFHSAAAVINHKDCKWTPTYGWTLTPAGSEKFLSLNLPCRPYHVLRLWVAACWQKWLHAVIHPSPSYYATPLPSFHFSFRNGCNLLVLDARPYKLNSQFIVTARLWISDSDTKFRVQSSTEFMLCQQ